MRARLRDEGGFGLIELVLAVLVLNVALLAIVGVFNAATVAVAKSHATSTASAVADAQMEKYRGLQNCAIWLDQWLLPASGSQYALDAASYDGTAASSPQIAYWNPLQAANAQSWATDGTDGSGAFAQANLRSCAYASSGKLTLPLTSAQNVDTLGLVTPPPTAVKPVQTVAGPDGTPYTVDTYVVLVQPANGEWTKQVTIVVRDPSNSSVVLARETAEFDPAAGS